MLSKYRGNNSELTLPDEVYAIGDSCFSGTYIKKIKFNANLQRIGSSAFANCPILEDVDTSLCSNLDILDSAFENCNALSTFNFQNVTHIGTEAFRNTGLKQIIMSKQTIELGNRVFRDCKKLVMAYIGDIITTENIYDYEPLLLFDGCDFLLDIRSPLSSGIRNKKGELVSKINDFCWWTFGTCLFTHFMCGSFYYDKDDKRHEMNHLTKTCVYCHGKMGNIETGPFSSYFGCLQCNRKKPSHNEYNKLLQWAYETVGVPLNTENDQYFGLEEKVDSHQPKTIGDIALICNTFINEASSYYKGWFKKWFKLENRSEKQKKNHDYKSPQTRINPDKVKGPANARQGLSEKVFCYLWGVAKNYNVLGGYKYYYTQTPSKVCLNIRLISIMFCANRRSHFCKSDILARFLYILHNYSMLFSAPSSNKASNSGRSMRSFSRRRFADLCKTSILAVMISFALV